MKRAIFAAVAATVAASLAGGCSAPPAREAQAETAPATGWTRPPAILSVRRGPATLIFSGEAEPGARVVLRNDAGVAYAAAADGEGRFEIRMTAPQGALLLRPETQVGQDAAASPDRLLILEGGRGPIAVLRTGGSTRRLDAAPALGAVDSDGEGALASGRTAEPGAAVSIDAGGEAARVTSDASGRWSVVLGPMGSAGAIRVGEAAFAWPGPGADKGGLQVERAGAGWRVGWSGPAGARQWTWMPDAAT
jgi:hypothetical protein